MSTIALLLQADPSTNVSPLGAGFGIGFAIVWLALVVLLVAALWKVFEKAGEPGWTAIVPIYNLYILLKIAGKPGWWLLLMFIPFVNFVVAIIAAVALAQKFGKGVGFALGLAFLSPIFYPILAWGDAQYSANA